MITFAAYLPHSLQNVYTKMDRKENIADSNRNPGLRLINNRNSVTILHLIPLIHLVLLVLLDDRSLGVARACRFVGALARQGAKSRAIFKTCLREMHACKRCMPVRCIPVRLTPVKCTPVRCTHVKCTPVRFTPVKCTPVRCIPVRYMPMRYMPVRCKYVRRKSVRYKSVRCTPVSDLSTREVCLPEKHAYKQFTSIREVCL
jgi:hypothetical protein